MEIENIPLFSYFGNKDNEIETIKNNLPNMSHIDTIIEPYCGSFALTRYLLTQYPDKTYICNDNDELLIKTYQTLQDNKKCQQLINFYKRFGIKDKTHYDSFKKENSVKSYLFTHIIYRIHYGMYDENKKRFNEKDINRLIHFNKNYKHVKFTCGDASIIINKYINKSKTFLFLDPPFLLTSSFYSFAKSEDLESFFKVLMNINNYKSKILAVCGDNFLLIPFYEKYKIKIKFKTTINYRGNTNNKHENIYVANY